MDFISYVVYAVGLLLLGSVVLFIKTALIDRRPQKFGLIMAVFTIPLFMLYYSDKLGIGADDQWPDANLRMREALRPLELEGLPWKADINFVSDLSPAVIIAAVILVRMTVFTRVSVRRRLQRIHDPIANFFALATFATLVGGTIVSTFALGWLGAIVVTVVFTLVYLGALALLAAFIEVAVEIAKLVAVWLKRKVFAIATRITRFASWMSSLSGRLVSRSFIERIREDQARQESMFLEEQEAQDRRLYEAYLRDRARKRQLAKRAGRLPAGADVEDPPFDALVSGEIPPTVVPALASPPNPPTAPAAEAAPAVPAVPAQAGPADQVVPAEQAVPAQQVVPAEQAVPAQPEADADRPGASHQGT